MIQRQRLQYASKIYDLGLLQIILNAEQVEESAPLVQRTLSMSARINDALLGRTNIELPSREIPLLWSHFRQRLEEIRKIAVENLGSPDYRKNFNLSLIELLRSVWQTCLDLLGAPPCAFSVFAMGSLSRLEAAAFSDLEYGMVVESDKFNDHSYAPGTTRIPLRFLIVTVFL
jgi:hypothetical protein